MKICSKCGRTFSADVDFCLEDGTPLANRAYSQADYPTQAFIPPTIAVPVAKRGTSPLLYALLGGMTVLAAVFGVILFMSNGSSNKTSLSSPNRNTEAPAVVSSPTAQTQTLTTAAVKALLDKWIASQNSRDFAAYSALYADEFVGYRTTVSGRSTRSDQRAWLRDRAKMLPNFISLTVTGERIRIDGELAVVNFTQTWRSARYCDVGDKELTVQIIDGQAKIRSEVLKNSAPCGD